MVDVLPNGSTGYFGANICISSSTPIRECDNHICIFSQGVLTHDLGYYLILPSGVKLPVGHGHGKDRQAGIEHI